MNYTNTKNFLYFYASSRINKCINDKNFEITQENKILTRKRNKIIRDNQSKYRDIPKEHRKYDIPFQNKKKITNNYIDPENSKIIKYIRLGKTTKNNPNFFTPKTIENLLNKLNFKDEFDLIWGSETERNENNFYFWFFNSLVVDLSKNNQGDNLFDSIEKCLLGYIPFAKFKAYDFLDKNLESKDINPYDYIFEEQIDTHFGFIAIYRLFLIIEEDFTQSFNEFIHKEEKFWTKSKNSGKYKNTQKTRLPSYQDKDIENFVNKYLDKIIDSNTPDDSDIGLRVYSILIADIHKKEFLNSESVMARSPESYGYYLTPSGKMTDEDYNSKLLELSDNYVNNLIQLQSLAEENYEDTLSYLLFNQNSNSSPIGYVTTFKNYTSLLEIFKFYNKHGDKFPEKIHFSLKLSPSRLGNFEIDYPYDENIKLVKK